jgi:4-amino-4-deoxy-L-arabinose transferase-like glycosyltransferase
VRPAPTPRRRYAVVLAAITLLVLVLIVLNVVGVELWPHFVSEPAVPSVRARSLQEIVHLAPTAASSQPSFLTRGPDGTLAVSDRLQRRILRFDLDGKQLSEWGPALSSNVDLTEPAGIAAGSSAWFVLDRAQPQIVRLDGSGAVQTVIDLRPFNTYGPNGLAVDAAGSLYVADTGGSRVLVFGPDGHLARTLGAPGSEFGQLKQPMSLAIAPDGRLFVADWENARIDSWGPNLQPAEAIATGFRPLGVDVDDQGRIYTVDPDAQSVDIFAAGGQRLARLNISLADHQLDFPSQLAVTSDGSLLFVLGHDGLLKIALGTVAPAPSQPLGSGGLLGQLPGFAVGIILGMLLAVALPRWRGAMFPGVGARFRAPAALLAGAGSAKLEYAALGALLLGMLLTRLVRLGTLPDTLNPDEADNIQGALRILNGSPPDNGFFGFDWYGEPAFNAYVFALFMKVFGTSQFAARLPTALVSVVVLGLFFALLRRQVSAPSALIATLLMGSQLWYVHLSRMAWNNLHVTLFTLGAVWSLLKAMDNLAANRLRRALLWTAVCGVWGALSLYGYTSGRLVLPSLFAVLPLALIRDSKNRKLILLGFATIGGVAALLFLPQAVYTLAHWEGFARRMADVSILNKPEFQQAPLTALGNQVIANLLGFWVGAFNNMPSHFPPGEPLLDRLTGLLVLAGMILSLTLRRFRTRLETWLWWSVFVVGWFFSEVITERTPDGARGIGWMPALFFFAAISVELAIRSKLYARLATGSRGDVRSALYQPAAVVVASVVALMVAATDISHYVYWSNLPETRRMRDPFITEAEFPSWSAAVIEQAKLHQAGFNVGEWRAAHPLDAGA